MRNQSIIHGSVLAAAVLCLSVAFADAQLTLQTAAPAPADDVEGEAPAAAIRVGVFDVNQAFNAYPGIQRAQQRSQELQADMQQAGAAQDQARMGEIQQEFQQLQQRAVQEFQADLERVLPDIARAAQVPLIVHDVAYAAPNLESVDLTGQVVEALRQGETPERPAIPLYPPDAP